MVGDVKDITETAESKATAEALDRARLARERREAEQRKRLDELRAHAAAAQAQREKRDEDRRRRIAEQKARDDDRRQQVEERKRAIWEASISRRESLLQREKDRAERMERARAARSAPRPAYAFGSSTPRLLEPLDSSGFFWAARRAASTTNVMFASAPLTRRASALHLDTSDNDNKDEPERSPQPTIWSSVARRRTDLVPTIPAPRPPGRAHSMTRLDTASSRSLHTASPSMHHLNRSQPRSGDTTPGSRPGSAMSNAAGVVRRATSAPRKPRPASIAGTGVNTPRGTPGGPEAWSAATTPGLSPGGTPAVSRDGTAAEVPRRAAPRRPRPVSIHVTKSPATLSPADGKPPVHRKPKPAKEHDKTPRNKSLSASPGRTLSPSPAASKEPSVDKDISKPASTPADFSHVNAAEVTQKLEALQIQNGHSGDDKENENKENIQVIQESKPEIKPKPVEVNKNDVKIEVQKPVENKEDKKEEKKDISEKSEENEMTASMTSRRITTEEEAKAALAERRRRAREELERQAELERQRLQREAEEEAERQRQEEERQRREEEEARELAALQRKMEEEKLRKAIEAQQQLEREEAERKAREEAEKQARLKEEDEKRRAAEQAELQRKLEAERQERERLVRKQRVEAIMARTRLRKNEEEKKQQEEEKKQHENNTEATAPSDNGNAAVSEPTATNTSQAEEPKTQAAPVVQSNESSAPDVGSNTAPNNGNVTADLLGLSDQTETEDTSQEPATKHNQSTNPFDNATNANPPTLEPNNGNVQLLDTSNVGHISANFIQTERINSEQTKMENNKLIEENDFSTHNGHGGAHNHPLTLQNAI